MIVTVFSHLCNFWDGSEMSGKGDILSPFDCGSLNMSLRAVGPPDVALWQHFRFSPLIRWCHGVKVRSWQGTFEGHIWVYTRVLSSGSVKSHRVVSAQKVGPFSAVLVSVEMICSSSFIHLRLSSAQLKPLAEWDPLSAHSRSQG